MIKVSLEQRDFCCKTILQEYSIDEELKSILKDPILKYANSNLSEQTLERMLHKNMSIYSTINTLKTNVNIFSGYIYEFLCVYDYNMHRNKDHILTILNPDSSSKTDLLHIINTKKGRIVVPGGDVKSGSSDYVLNQYEKLLKTKYDIPFIDYSGYLTKDKHRLSTKQIERLEKLHNEYPNKRPVEPTFSSEDINKIKVDILAYFETGYLPSEREYYNVKFENERYIKNRESREELVRLAISRKREDESIKWSALRTQTSENWSWYDKNQEKLKKPDYVDEYQEWFGSRDPLESRERQNEDDIRTELVRLKEKRATYDSANMVSEQSVIKKIFKKSKNFLAKIIFDVMNNEQITVLQDRLNARDFTQSVEEINYEIQETKRLERERYEEEERELYEEEQDQEYEYDYNYLDSDYDYGDDVPGIERESPTAHSVRSHTRILSDGREIPVRAHERGRRD